MPNVFISYVRENTEDVQRLAQALKAYGVKVWLDKNQIKPGYRFADAIRDAISQGDFFIACFSAQQGRANRRARSQPLGAEILRFV